MDLAAFPPRKGDGWKGDGWMLQTGSVYLSDTNIHPYTGFNMTYEIVTCCFITSTSWVSLPQASSVLDQKKRKMLEFFILIVTSAA